MTDVTTLPIFTDIRLLLLPENNLPYIVGQGVGKARQDLSDVVCTAPLLFTFQSLYG